MVLSNNPNVRVNAMIVDLATGNIVSLVNNPDIAG